MKWFSLFFMLISLNCLAQKPTIYGIGDSTMANKSKPEVNPEHGWGQVFPQFLNDSIIVAEKSGLADFKQYVTINGNSEKRLFIQDNLIEENYFERQQN